MFKSLFLAFLLGTAAFLANGDEPPPSIVPKLEFKPIPREHLYVVPGSLSSPDGGGLMCDTLRGTGVIAIEMDGTMFYIIIDCPSQPMKDI